MLERRVRTTKYLVFRTREKPLKTKGNGWTKKPELRRISSQPRYDHFNTSPYDVIIFILLYSAEKCKGMGAAVGKKAKLFAKNEKKQLTISV